MLPILMAGLAGLLFGLGLTVSGMVIPAKVQNFLDITGTWDPSLLWVMGGAIAVVLPGYRWLRQNSSPWFVEEFQWPTRQDIDIPLVQGAVFFGLGWALSGLCPGPALTVLPTMKPGVIGFVLMMLVGAAIAHHQQRLTDLANQPTS